MQMFISDGAKLVRDAFELPKEKVPAIISIDELDAISTEWACLEGARTQLIFLFVLLLYIRV